MTYPFLDGDGLAIGTGPSFHKWRKNPTVGMKRYGCGIASQFVPLDVYTVGDTGHYADVPQTIPVYGSKAIITEGKCPCPRENLREFNNDIPHGGSCGGMAVSVACMFHSRVFLVGFDGHDVKDQVENFIPQFSDLLEFWRLRGRELYSLMDSTVFKLEKWRG